MPAETALLSAALPAVGNQWKTYEPALVRSVSSSNPLVVLKLVETLRRVTEPELARRLSELLVLRAGVRPKSWEWADVAGAVRQALGGGSSSTLTVADRWLALRDEATAALQSHGSTDPRAVLSDLVKLAHLTTLAVALTQGDAGLASFDAAIDHPPRLDVTSGSADPLDLAAGLLMESYRERARLCGASPTLLADAKTPGQTLELIVEQWAERSSHGDPAAALAGLSHQRRAYHFLATDDLQLTAAMQRVLLGLLASRISADRPQQAVAVQRIAAETAAAAANAKSVLVQLRDQEAGLLKLWMLYAPES